MIVSDDAQSARRASGTCAALEPARQPNIYCAAAVLFQKHDLPIGTALRTRLPNALVIDRVQPAHLVRPHSAAGHRLSQSIEIIGIPSPGLLIGGYGKRFQNGRSQIPYIVCRPSPAAHGSFARSSTAAKPEAGDRGSRAARSAGWPLLEMVSRVVTTPSPSAVRPSRSQATTELAGSFPRAQENGGQTPL